MDFQPLSHCGRPSSLIRLKLRGKTGVYAITNIFDGKQYIGSASRSFSSRLNRHLWQLKRREHDNYRLQTAWCRCGEDSFDVEILELCAPEECIKNEQKWMDSLRPWYNILPIAGSPLGSKRSPEVVARMKGRKQPPCTPETRAILSALHKGRKFSPETIEKMREAAKGRVISESAKVKISQSLIGNRRKVGCIPSAETREKMRISHGGRSPTPEAIEKTRQAHLGSKRSLESRLKMSIAAKARCARNL